MRILVLQIAPALRRPSGPRFEPLLAGLLALLRKRGHQLTLLSVSSVDIDELKRSLARSLPQLVYADIRAVCVSIARRTLQHLQEKQFLPVVVGGELAALDPASALSLPGVQAVVPGEAEATLLTYLERLQDPTAGQLVQGVWLRDETGVAMPSMPWLVEELASLPFAERELFNYDEHVRRTGEIEISVGRGCPQACGYCPNSPIARLYEGRGQWVRRRTAGHILAEIEQLSAKYPGARLVRFLGHAFALDAQWLTPFLSEYAGRCQLPFGCHLRLNSLTPALVAELKAARCSHAEAEVISGSDFIRNEIFAMELSGEQIRQSMRLLHDAGIRVQLVVYAGSPYESEVSLEETSALLAALRPDAVDVRAYFPWPQTAAALTAQENGWLHPRGEEQLRDDRSGLNMAACRPELIEAWVRRTRAAYPGADGRPWWQRMTTHSRSALGRLFGRDGAPRLH